jgi:PhnB protein
MSEHHIRHGLGAVRPYVYGYLDVIALMESAFDAEILEKLPALNGFHVEARVGDSVVVLEASDPPPQGGRPSSIYVYVPDVDAAFERAVASGAKKVSAPEDKPYDERAAGVSDRFGNIWWIATYRHSA